MTTHEQIETIILLTGDAREKAKNGYIMAARESMVKAIAVIDAL